MDHVVKGVEKFQSEAYVEKKELFEQLATGQAPEVLFVTCADSRIDPGLITQTNPGDLFVCRNAGNIVPPFSGQTSGEIASIEYAVAALGVQHIVVCGHTECGAMKGAMAPESLAGVPNVADWLKHSVTATEVVKERCGGSLCGDNLLEVIEENVLQQIQHLKTHPKVAAKVAAGTLKLHGWVYDIKTGGITAFDEAAGKFAPLADVQAS